ncbi:MAG: glycosyltransferase [Acidobacteriota bacterium]
MHRDDQAASEEGSAPPLVSVIIPCFNAEKFIQRTLESVYSQKHVCFEVVLVDDGCSDGSIEIVRSLFPNVRIHSHEGHGNKGYAASVNLGISKAGGGYLAFLDADDVWLVDTYLSEQVATLENHPEAVLSFCNGVAIDQNDRVLWHWNEESLFVNFDKRLILQNCFMLTGSTVVRRSAMALVGDFNVSLQSADHDMWIRLSELGDFACSPRPVLGYRQHPGQISSRRKQWEDGFAILRDVRRRGYYNAGEIFRRKAVLHYRLSAHDKSQAAYVSMLFHALMSLFYDPARALSQAKRWALTRCKMS